MFSLLRISPDICLVVILAQFLADFLIMITDQIS